MSDDAYGLLVAFDDQSPAYVYGFEAGMIWAQMRAGTTSGIEVTTHAENRETIRRMAISDGWTIECNPSEVDGWDYTVLVKDQPAPARANPHGLRVV